MRYVVTGGAGFIGSHISKYLVNHGHNVSIIDNLYTGKKKNLESIKDKIDPKLTRRIWSSIIWGFVDFQKKNFWRK